MYFSVWSKAACLWSAGFADLTWSWKLQTLKHEMCNRFRVKLCLIQPEKPTITRRWPLYTTNEPWCRPKEEKKPGDIYSANASAVLCYSAAVKARRKMDVSLFADCEIGYIGEKKHFAHFQRSTLQPISTASSVNICIYSPSPSPTFQ